MKIFFISAIFMIALSIGSWSCRNCKPVERPLHDFGKACIEYAGTPVFFWNQDSVLALFNYSAPVTDFIISDFRGLECGDFDELERITFDLTSPTLPYVFDFGLSPYFNDDDWLRVSYLDDLSANLYLNIKDSSIFISGEGGFLEEITLNGANFQDIYHLGLDSITTSEISDFYFTKGRGIIGFRTQAGELWSVL